MFNNRDLETKRPTCFSCPKFFWDHHFFWLKIFCSPKFFWTHKFLDPQFCCFQNFVGPKIFGLNTFFGPKIIFRPKIVSVQKKFSVQKLILEPKVLLQLEFNTEDVSSCNCLIYHVSFSYLMLSCAFSCFFVLYPVISCYVELSFAIPYNHPMFCYLMLSPASTIYIQLP